MPEDESSLKSLDPSLKIWRVTSPSVRGFVGMASHSMINTNDFIRRIDLIVVFITVLHFIRCKARGKHDHLFLLFPPEQQLPLTCSKVYLKLLVRVGLVHSLLSPHPLRSISDVLKKKDSYAVMKE